MHEAGTYTAASAFTCISSHADCPKSKTAKRQSISNRLASHYSTRGEEYINYAVPSNHSGKTTAETGAHGRWLHHKQD
jgi:hypothetical protein